MDGFLDVEKAVDELLPTLPKERNWDGDLVLYQGTWFMSGSLKSVVAFQDKFIAADDDIILTSFPKAGTTWTKSLLYAIVNRGRFPDLKASPLQYTSTMKLVPTMDLRFFLNGEQFMGSPTPRILSTHLPYASLPGSIKTSACKMVYVWRNPMDLFISLWHFFQQVKFNRGDDSGQPECLPLDQCFDKFCNGIVSGGMYWDHVMEYWKACQEAPTKILFLNYEEMKEDTAGCVKKMGDFLGFPFSAQEEEKGTVDHIVNFCSFENLKNLEVHQTGTAPNKVAEIPVTAFFRKGTVGDSDNYFTPAMKDRIMKITQEKWADSGLSL